MAKARGGKRVLRAPTQERMGVNTAAAADEPEPHVLPHFS